MHGCIHGRANFVLQSTDMTDRFHMGTYLGRLQYNVLYALDYCPGAAANPQRKRISFCSSHRNMNANPPDVTVAICYGSVASKIGYCAPSVWEGLSG